MRGTNASTPWMTPQRLTPSTHCQSRCVAVSRPPQAATPALLQSTCTAPNVSKARAASACTWASSVTSVRTASALTPSACASPATTAIAASSTSATTTLAPSRANRSVSARPIPLAPPVTTAVRPRSSTSTSLGIGSPRTAGPQPRDVLRLGLFIGSPRTAGPQPRDVLRLALRLQNRPEYRLQGVRVGRLAQEGGEPGGLGPPHGIRAGIAGQCDDRRRPAAGHRRHLSGEVEAVDAAEMEIEDDHARARAADELQRRLARLRHEHARAGEENGQKLAEGTAGIRVVFDDQDRTHAAARPR